MTSSTPLRGRVALVTGGTRNIGRSICLELARQGADVAVLASRNGEDMARTLQDIESLGRQALGLCADVSSAEAMEQAVQQLDRRFSQLDILVCCAAIRPHQPVDELAPEAWRQVMAVNLDGPFLATRAALPLLSASDQGAIITFGGVSAHLGAAERASVIASKMGVVGLTRALAVELAERCITANCVVPGQIDTQRPVNSPTPQLASGSTAAQRLGRPEEVASMVAYLAGPDARYITGQTLHINGGRYLG